jgi:DNA repair protein RadC
MAAGAGTTPVPISEIAKGALLANAVSVILAHNHPSGSLDPSTQDLAFKAKTKKALSLLDIRLVDFQIVNDETYRSITD